MARTGSRQTSARLPSMTAVSTGPPAASPSRMAVETTDFPAVLDFIRRAKLRNCYVPTPTAPPQFQDEKQLLDLIPYLGLGLKARPAPGEAPAARAFATGWTGMEGVMLLQPEP